MSLPTVCAPGIAADALCASCTPAPLASPWPRKNTPIMIKVFRQNPPGSESDRIFFEQNPSREYRARLMTPDELAIAEQLNAVPPIPAKMFWFTVVRQIAPGRRVRGSISAEMPPRFFLMNEEIPERIARYLFEEALRKTQNARTPGGVS
jgi:hypothetical protein